jgi:ribonuclease P protein component
MLSRQNRLNKKELDFVFKKGSTFKKDFLLLKVIENKSDLPPKFSVVAPLKISKKTTQRNRLKRLMREALRREIGNVKKGVQAIFIALPEIQDKDLETIHDLIDKLLKIAKIKE